MTDDESGDDDKVVLSLSLVVKHSSRERCRVCKVSETRFNVVNQLTWASSTADRTRMSSITKQRRTIQMIYYENKRSK